MHQQIDMMNQRIACDERRGTLDKLIVLQDPARRQLPARLGDPFAPTSKVRLSELFTAPDRALLIYQCMFGNKQASPCPMRENLTPTAIDRHEVLAIEWQLAIKAVLNFVARLRQPD